MLIIIGALFDRTAQVLWVIAILSNLTVVHRMIYTYRECNRMEAGPPADETPVPVRQPLAPV